MQTKTTKKYHFTSNRVAKKKWQYQMLKITWSNWNSHTFAVRVQIILENSLPVSHKIKPTSTLWLNKVNPRYLSRRNKKLYPQKDCIRRFIAILYIISKKEESTQMFSNKGMDKQILTHGTDGDVWNTNQQYKGRNHCFNTETTRMN